MKEQIKNMTDKFGISFINKNDVLEVEFELMTLCNYKCPYCYQKDDRTFKWIHIEKFKNIIKEFMIIGERLGVNSIHFVLMGGELSLSEKTFEYFRELHNIVNHNKIEINVVLVTNFSGKDMFYEKLLSEINDRTYNFLLTISIHEYYINFNYDEIIEKMKKIKPDFFLINYVTTTETTFNIEKEKISIMLNNNEIYNYFINFNIIDRYKDRKEVKPRICNAQMYLVNSSGIVYDDCSKEVININEIRERHILCKIDCPFNTICNKVEI